MGVHFKIVIAAYNSNVLMPDGVSKVKRISWIEKCFQSIVSQTYHDFEILVVDDASTDGTANLVQEFAFNNISARPIVARLNNVRTGALQNQVEIIRMSKPYDEDVIVIVDGDDWLAHDRVLNRLNEIYMDPDVWITHGNYQEYPSGRKTTVNIPWKEGFDIRAGRYILSHLRTFKYFLFKNIRDKDFRFTGTDQWFRSNGDSAIMKPMAEMAGPEHVKFVDETLLIYNFGNPLGDGKVNRQLQAKCGEDIARKPRYPKLTKEELIYGKVR
jgi:glycosyltransferase involved in cell wall biosynthesis